MVYAQYMEQLPKVSEEIGAMLDTFRGNRDSEIQALAEVLPQYITDHNDRDAWWNCDRQVNKLATALDKMIARLAKWQTEAQKIEASVENFYGD